MGATMTLEGDASSMVRALTFVRLQGLRNRATLYLPHSVGKLSTGSLLKYELVNQ